MATYLTEFKDRASIEDAYECKLPEDAEILLAWYGYGDYSGSSFVLYRQGGTLYEVNGSHCSCYGLEGQWEPEETTVAALRHILEKGTKFSSGEFDGDEGVGDALRAVLDALESC